MLKTAVLAGSALALIVPAAASAAVGTNTVYDRVTTKAPGVGQLYRANALSGGDVDQLNVFLDRKNTARKVIVGLYARRTSGALTQRARCVISRPQAGAWNRCAVPTTPIRAATNYWLAVLQPAHAKGRLRYREARVASAGTAYLSKRRGLTTLPSRWAGGAARLGFQASIYADRADSAPSLSPFPRLRRGRGGVAGVARAAAADRDPVVDPLAAAGRDSGCAVSEFLAELDPRGAWKRDDVHVDRVVHGSAVPVRVAARRCLLDRGDRARGGAAEHVGNVHVRGYAGPADGDLEGDRPSPADVLEDADIRSR